MKSTVDPFQSAHAAITDGCTEAMECLLSGMETISSYQISSARHAVAVGSAQVSSLRKCTSPAEVVMLQGHALQPAFDNSLSYFRGMVSLGAQLQSQMAGIAGARQKLLARQVVTLIAELGAGSPSGAEVIMSGVQSWLQATEQAMDSVANASRELSERVDAASSVARAKAVQVATPG